MLSGGLQADDVRSRIRVASPSHTEPLYLLHDGRTIRVRARGGIPSLERAIGDRETAGVPAWRDLPADTAWAHNTPEKVLKHLDRFSGIPDAPAWERSWAEWLYFNGRGRMRASISPSSSVHRSAKTEGTQACGSARSRARSETTNESHPITNGAALAAPDLTIGASFVRLEGMQYRIHLDLRGTNGRRWSGSHSGASPGRLFPRAEFTGARGWLTGYVVPVMSGTLNGTLDVNGERISLDGGAGYHDHNWGFWQGVSWRWGQVQHGDLSFLYGRIFPPREAADPERLPGFLGVVGPGGPLAYTTDVTITETNDARGRPLTITINGSGNNLDLQLRFEVESMVTRQGSASAASGARASTRSPTTLFSSSRPYTVTGRARIRRHFAAGKRGDL